MPKMNGAVEAANKNVKRIVAKMVENYKDWHEKLPYALHAYRTNIRSNTGATPFSLVVARAFDKKVRLREFEARDLVLKKILLNQEDAHGKWALNYEGPYIVKNTLLGRALVLKDMDGNILPKPVNTDTIKRFDA
ncbi:PREDICTED: uncharacterized protein LOC109337894 [Lupinus angustifolius]|uniref:uncharacterized protein LOC109337894 n=1 Tax=Lupinus angustifolius TaxID=3871 RepID=UPI00092FC2E3|nr:PREDICTED: uncharacterized protein LOC109337894 [Lupinus angustifolius]